jgi:hypothetical protein
VVYSSEKPEVRILLGTVLEFNPCFTMFSNICSQLDLCIQLTRLRFRIQAGRRMCCIDAVKPSMTSQATHPTSLNITFLGTGSAQPSSTRNHSSLALRLGGDVWLFDCGEATYHQLQKSNVKMGKIEKIFITHTHGGIALEC